MNPHIIVYPEAEKSYMEANRSKCNPIALQSFYELITDYDGDGKITVALDMAAELGDYLTSKGISYVAQNPIWNDTKKPVGNCIIFSRM